MNVFQSLHIWGKPHRVVAARNLLETMISRFDKESVAKREGLWAKAQLHWEPRETYEKSKKDLEASLKELKREPETLDPASKVSNILILKSLELYC